MAEKTIKHGVVKEKDKKAIEYGISTPKSDFDKRANQGDADVTYVKGK